jgi:hypothetical protein
MYTAWLWNSVKISLITSALVVALTALSAYSFSRFRFKGRRVGLLGLLLVQMFPQMLAIVALYVLLLTMGQFFPFVGMNTHTGLIMIYLGGAMGFNTWLMKGYFDTIPHSLEESAKVDGATPFQAFVKIVLPLVPDPRDDLRPHFHLDLSEFPDRERRPAHGRSQQRSPSACASSSPITTRSLGSVLRQSRDLRLPFLGVFIVLSATRLRPHPGGVKE